MTAQTQASTVTESALAAKLKKLQEAKKAQNKKVLKAVGYTAGAVGVGAALYVGARMLHAHLVKTYPLEGEQADAIVDAGAQASA